jgi:hypothetical protein
MILKLTNAVTALKGRKVFVNTDHIVAMYEVFIEGKVATFVYGVTKDNWEVRETMAQIEKQLEQLDNVK